jgi:hypothetical protein
VRLGIPFVVYFLLINPFVAWLGSGARWQLGPGPMWFVEVLLLFTLVWLAVRPLVPAIRPPRIDAVTTSALALLMGVGSYLIRIRWPVNTWLPFPTIQPAHATQYVCLFAVGVWLAGSDLAGSVSPALTRYWRRAILLATVAVLVAFVSVDVPGDGVTNLDPLIGGATWPSFVVALWEQVVAVGLITNLVAAFAARAGGGPVLASAAAAAYTVYVVHPVVVVALALAFRGLPIPSVAKFLLIAPIAVVVVFGVAPWIRRAPALRQVL